MTIVINRQMGLLVQIVRLIQMKRALTEVAADSRQNFWRLMNGGFLDLAVLEWCKIFGSNAEPTHWTSTNESPDEFRKELLAKLEVTKHQWQQYWLALKKYRDELVAHHELSTYVEIYPNLDLAFRSSCFYFDWLNGRYGQPDVEPFEGLSVYSERFYHQAIEIGSLAVSASSEVQDFES